MQEDTYRGDGLNLYAYCRNNPVYYVDPSGHCAEIKSQNYGGLGTEEKQLPAVITPDIRLGLMAEATGMVNANNKASLAETPLALPGPEPMLALPGPKPMLALPGPKPMLALPGPGKVLLLEDKSMNQNKGPVVDNPNNDSRVQYDGERGTSGLLRMNLQFFASSSESGTSSVAKPNHGQGFSPNGYNPKPGERTFEGYVKQNADPEIVLYTQSAGFNNGNGVIGGQFKRIGAKPGHGVDGPHVHQPLRNSNPNGLIFGDVGSKTKNGGVTSPNAKDVKQLYEYLNNGKYHE